jgi:hypothetical protein
MSVGFTVQSIPLINSSLSFTEMKQKKNVIVHKTTNSQTVVLQSDFQLIQLKGLCLVYIGRSKSTPVTSSCRMPTDWRTGWYEFLTYE